MKNRFLLALLFPIFALASDPPVSLKGLDGTLMNGKWGLRVPNYQATDTGGITGLIETGSTQLLSNGGFEANTVTSGWTVTAGTASKDTSTQLDGIAGLSMSLSSVNGTVLSQTYSSCSKYNGQNMEATAWIKTSLTTVQVCALVAGNETNCYSVPGTGTWVQAPVNFVAAGSCGVRVKTSSSSSGTVKVDLAYLGLARNIGSVAQAQLIGQIKVSGCSAAWTTTSTSLAAFAAQTGCTYTVIQGSGNVSAPSTNIPGIKFESLPPGNYTLSYEGTALSHWVSSAGSAIFQFWDGTNSANESSYQGDATTGGPYVGGSGIRQTISYAAPQSNVTLSIRGKASASGAEAWIFGTTNNPGVISVYWFPTQSQQVVTQQNAANVLGTVFYTAASICPANSLSADGSAVSRSAYASLFQNIGTTFGTGDGSTTFNLPDMRGIFVRGSGSQTISSISYSGTLGTKQGDRMQGHTHNLNRSGSATFSASLTNQIPNQSPSLAGTDIGTGEPLTDGTNGTPRTGSETRPANIGMTPCIWYASQPAPLLAGSVTSGSSGTTRTESAMFAGASETTKCSSSPCTVYRPSSAWISSVTRTGLGSYTIAIASGQFSAAPICTCSGHALGALNACELREDSTTQVRVYTGTNATSEDNGVSITCSGPR